MLDHFTACHSLSTAPSPEAGLGAGTLPTAVPRGRGFANQNFEPRRSYHSVPSPHRFVAAFTLIEMLVVMAVIVVLLALLVPATTSLLRSLQISQSGQLIENQLDLARQAALSNNRSVEVRLCQVNGKFSAILPVLITTTTNAANANQPVYQTIGKPTFISDSVLIDSGTTLSTLVSPNGTSAAFPVSNYSNPPLEPYGQNYKYVSFRFKPDGTTDLNQLSLWFLTVHGATDPDPDPNSPNNFYTIQIDPYNGHISQFRP